MSAVEMCERLDIKSCKDTEKLKKAKDEVYLKGFYEGVMLVGECAGMKVSVSKYVAQEIAASYKPSANRSAMLSPSFVNV